MKKLTLLLLLFVCSKIHAQTDVRLASASGGPTTLRLSTGLYVAVSTDGKLVTVSTPFSISGNNVGIGTTTPTAKLHIVGSTDIPIRVVSAYHGVLLPKMTTAQRDAVSSPEEGEEIYNLTTHHKNIFDGTAWREITYTP